MLSAGFRKVPFRSPFKLFVKVPRRFPKVPCPEVSYEILVLGRFCKLPRRFLAGVSCPAKGQFPIGDLLVTFVFPPEVAALFSRFFFFFFPSILSVFSSYFFFFFFSLILIIVFISSILLLLLSSFTIFSSVSFLLFCVCQFPFSYHVSSSFASSYSYYHCFFFFVFVPTHDLLCCSSWGSSQLGIGSSPLI